MPLSRKLTPVGSVPLNDKVVELLAENPDVVTVKFPDTPIRKVVLTALVIEGAWSTTSLNAWLALGDTPLLAVMVSE